MITDLVILLLFSFYLTVTFVVGWYFISPALDWIGKKVQDLSIKGADYHHMVKTYRESGEGEDQST